MREQNPGMFKGAIFEIIENQMRDGTPPETRQTFDRLVASGHSHDEAMRLIGCVLTSEVLDMFKEGKAYNEERFLTGLRALPKLPWDKDGRE